VPRFSVSMSEILRKIPQKVPSRDALVFASGAMGRTASIPGEAEFLGGVSYCATCDAAFYRNREVVVVGISRSD